MSYSQIAPRTVGSTHTVSRRVRLIAIVAALLSAAALAGSAAPRAGAVSDSEELISFGGKGSGAGQLDHPTGIATDPVTGHVYVTETSNIRISEFTAWGNFVKAFGWDVAPGAVNEQQEVRVSASAGQFELSFGGFPTADLAFDAPGSASEGPGSVEAALNALPSISGSVSVEAVPGTIDGKIPYVYTIVFKGSLAGTDVAQISATGGTTPLSGGDPSTELETRTRADGTPGGTGLESCTTESGCKAGAEGSGAGQLERPDGIAVDAAGDVYVKEFGFVDNRVQKFDSAGHFLLMFGGDVNKTTNENVCTKAQLEGGDECGIGTPGTGPGQFSAGFNRGIALGSGGRLFVADDERIQRFNLQGEFEASVPVPGEEVQYLAFDPISGDLYVHFSGKGDIPKLDSTSGAEVGNIEDQGASVLAVDPAGNVYSPGLVEAGKDGGPAKRGVLQFGADGAPLSPPSCCVSPPASDAIPFQIEGLGTNAIGDLYVSYFHSFGGEGFIRIFGPGPVHFEAPPRVPPTIAEQFAISVDRNSAVLAAEINPHFWTDTRYSVQYGTGKCSEGGCEEERPVAPGALLTPKVFGSPVRTAGVFLEELKAGTTYHYRFVAGSTGGGPITGAEKSFTTYPSLPPPKVDCPKQQFRTGFSAPLPDCRAFEMVSPIDKNGGDVKEVATSLGFTAALDQSATGGERFTYSSYRAFAQPQAAPFVSQYLASREGGVGWRSKQINAPVGPSSLHIVDALFDASYRAFSADLCSGWVALSAEPVLAPGATEGYLDLYRRDNCGEGGYEALIRVKPTVEPKLFVPEFQGASADGETAILRVKDKLTEDAASGVWQAYYANGEGLRLLCVLPDGSPSEDNCSGGSGSDFDQDPAFLDLGRLASVRHALSADGSRAYWTTSGDRRSGAGKVYLRLNPGQPQSAIVAGECVEAEMACTLPVSETKSSKAARFLGASADGSKALFEVTEGPQAGSLYEFELEAGGSRLVAGKVRGVAGASEDLSRIYFVSEEALAGTTGATAGKPNLYLEDEGTRTFIATLSAQETTPLGFSNVSSKPAFHMARPAPDGRRLVFASTESLTGYDNADQVTGEADSEVYLYEVGSAGPVCISCSPSGARPHGVVLGGGAAGSFPTAASIPTDQFTLRSPRSLSADGARLFFDSYDALVPRDTNGKADVYEWEAASSQKECDERGADVYVPSSSGCLSLISSGQSPSDSKFLDASENGKDVFFNTAASLLPQDPGLIDVYDARVDGGLPTPPAPPGPCQGEACQNAPPPPNDPAPASASFRGAGNPSTRSKGRCAKGKARRKGRCVAKKQKRAKGRHNRDANHSRRSAR